MHGTVVGTDMAYNDAQMSASIAEGRVGGVGWVGGAGELSRKGAGATWGLG